MKYIRTKDGRIGKFYQDQSFTITCSLGCIDKENILNQADTIEELCDEFMVIDKTWEEPLHIVLDTTDDMKSYLPSEIFGAIWTDKGLIYVAKMNDKGELELL